MAATVDRREAAFLAKEGKPWRKSMCCNFWFVLLLVLLALFVWFCFCCMEDVTTVISSLYSVQEPSEALMENEWVHGIVIPSTCARRWESWLVPEQLASFKAFPHQGSMIVLQVMWEMRAKVMVDLSVGLQKSDPGEVGMFLCSSCENRGPPSLGEEME